MLLAGLYAVIWPAQALTVLVLAGGILLVIDGALGLWSLTFGGGKSGNYWFDVVHNALSLILGMSDSDQPADRDHFDGDVPGDSGGDRGDDRGGDGDRRHHAGSATLCAYLAGAAVRGSYVLFGIALFLALLFSIILLVIFGGVLMIIFAFGLFGWAWRLYQRSRAV